MRLIIIVNRTIGVHAADGETGIFSGSISQNRKQLSPDSHRSSLAIKNSHRAAPNSSFASNRIRLPRKRFLLSPLSSVSSASGVSLFARWLIESSTVSMNRGLDENQLPILLFFGRRVTLSVISVFRSEPQMSTNLSQSRRHSPGMSNSNKGHGIAFLFSQGKNSDLAPLIATQSKMSKQKSVRNEIDTEFLIIISFFRPLSSAGIRSESYHHVVGFA